jgi:hypothetical protein
VAPSFGPSCNWNCNKNQKETQLAIMKSFYELVQTALPVLTTIPPSRKLDDALIESCADYSDAVRLCLDNRIRKLQEGEIANYLGFKRAQLAKVKMGLAKLTSDQEELLQHLCSNVAIDQFRAMRKSQLKAWLATPEKDIPEEMKAVVAQMVREQIASMGYVRVA